LKNVCRFSPSRVNLSQEDISLSLIKNNKNNKKKN